MPLPQFRNTTRTWQHEATASHLLDTAAYKSHPCGASKASRSFRNSQAGLKAAYRLHRSAEPPPPRNVPWNGRITRIISQTYHKARSTRRISCLCRRSCRSSLFLRRVPSGEPNPCAHTPAAACAGCGRPVWPRPKDNRRRRPNWGPPKDSTRTTLLSNHDQPKRACASQVGRSGIREGECRSPNASERQRRSQMSNSIVQFQFTNQRFADGRRPGPHEVENRPPHAL